MGTWLDFPRLCIGGGFPFLCWHRLQTWIPVRANLSWRPWGLARCLKYIDEECVAPVQNWMRLQGGQKS